MNRLNTQTLLSLDPTIAQPRYDRANLNCGIVHLGIGAFHRAHQAVYTETVLNRHGGDWGIVGCSLRSGGVRDQLAPQNGLYTVAVKSSKDTRYQVIGAVKKIVLAPENPAVLIEQLSAGEIKIVTLTITEKGYCHDPATGDLNLEHPNIVHDLAHPSSPKSAIGFLVYALQQRHQNNLPGFTILSCDNLPDNGKVCAKVVTQFAQAVSPELNQWIQKNVTFPSSMIDRIVPATTETDRENTETILGARDEGVVVTEPFTQWVIEDNFLYGRPQWEDAGAQLVNDVSVYEHMKLKLLNGSHSMLAYAGYLSGFETISDVMEEPAFVRLATRFMNVDAGETVLTPENFDIDHYKQELRERFANTSLKHRTWQIAMDGSQKLPQRLLATIRDQLTHKAHIDLLCLGVAAWIRYVSGSDDKGDSIDVCDPMAEILFNTCQQNSDATATVHAIVSLQEIFGTDLINEQAFVTRTSEWLTRFNNNGVLDTIRVYL